MKTISLLMFVGFFAINSSLFADELNFSAKMVDEAYVNDIPFNTETIYKSYLETAAFFSTSKAMIDEAYISDIPFDTYKIAEANLLSNSIMAGKMPEEVYIDDIPVNTSLVAKDDEARNKSNTISVTIPENTTYTRLPSDLIKVEGENITFGEVSLQYKAENLEKDLTLMIEKLTEVIRDHLSNGKEVITFTFQNVAGNDLESSPSCYTISIKSNEEPGAVSLEMNKKERIVKE